MKRWIFPIIGIVVLGSLIAWRLGINHKAAAAQLEQRQQRTHTLPSVNVAPVVIRDVVDSFESVGNVQAPVNVNIGPKSAGRVDAVLVHSGDAVKAGQILVRMDTAEPLANVAMQQANVAQAKQKLAEAELTQNPTDVGVTSTIREQQAALGTAQANLYSAQTNYESTVATAQATVTDDQGKVDGASAAVSGAQAGVRSAQANLVDAQAKFNRQNTLFKKGYVSAQDLDDATAAVEVQKAQVDVANQQLSSAKSALGSAKAQLNSAKAQVSIVKTTSTAGIQSSKAQVAQARASLASAEANTAQRPAYAANLEALRATVAAAEAQLSDMQAVLGQTVLTAPVDGFVTARFIDPGAQATAGQTIVTVQGFRHIWVVVPVPEEVTNKVYVGQSANVVLDALPGRTFTGNVTAVIQAADPSSRQFNARVTLDNPKNLIKPGMFARVEFIVARVDRALTIPREAVQQSPAGSLVYVVGADGVASRRVVTTGASDTNGIQVVTGVQAGEQVVVMSAMPLKDGQKVRLAVQNAAAGGGGHRHQKATY